MFCSQQHQGSSKWSCTVGASHAMRTATHICMLAAALIPVYDGSYVLLRVLQPAYQPLLAHRQAHVLHARSVHRHTVPECNACDA
jgi:hypothetical protein